MDYAIKALFKKYAENQCAAEELKAVEQLLRSGAYLEEWATVMQEDALSGADVSSHTATRHPFRREALFTKIEVRIDRPSRSYQRLWLASIAATFLICLTTGLWYTINNATQTQLCSIATQAGQQKIVTLGDGSRIVLNNGSSLTYPEQFSGKKREVYLQGEAFFDIKHDTRHPFIVHAGKLNVQVLGTSFNIKAYANEAKETVCVATGKVGVTSQLFNRTHFLLPNEQLLYNNGSNAYRKMLIPAEDIAGWQRGTLVFNQESFEDIILVLERRYGINAHIRRKSLMHKQLTGRFQNKPLKDVLDILARTGGFAYNLDHNKVIIL